MDVSRIVIEGRKGTDDPAEDRHRMRIAAEAAEKGRQLLVHHRVVGNVVNELLLLLGSRQLPVEEEIGDLEEVAFGGKLLDRVSPVEQYALIAIDIGDARATGSSGHKPGIVGEVAGLGVQLADVDDTRPDRPAQDKNLYLFCV